MFSVTPKCISMSLKMCMHIAHYATMWKSCTPYELDISIWGEHRTTNGEPL